MSLEELVNPERKSWMNIYPTSVAFVNLDVPAINQLSDYEEISVLATTTTFFIAPQIMTFKIVRFGDRVTLSWSEVQADGVGPAFVDFNPSVIVPSRFLTNTSANIRGTYNLVENGVPSIPRGLMHINSSGGIRFGKSIDSSTGLELTLGSGPCRIFAGSLTWVIN